MFTYFFVMASLLASVTVFLLRSVFAVLLWAVRATLALLRLAARAASALARRARPGIRAAKRALAARRLPTDGTVE